MTTFKLAGVIALTFGFAHASAAAPVNLALAGSASQSSTFCCDGGVDGAASKAIDGNTNGHH